MFVFKNNKKQFSHNYMRVASLVTFLALFINTVILPVFTFYQFAEASFTQNNSLGSWNVDFNANQQGIAPDGAPLRENITIDTTSGVAKITPTFSSGYFHTVSVSPNSFTAWNQVIVDGTYSNTNDLRISLYTCANNPITGFQNMNLGPGGVIDISSLSATFTCIKARADLTDSGGPRPVINNIKITWTPLPVFGVTHSAQLVRPVADGVVYAINYAVSYVDDTGVVVWAPLPRVSDGTVTDFTVGYGITPDPTFVSASSGGLYTATAITVAGISVPANSVYWNLGTIPAGRSGTLTYELATENNWQNGIKYHSQAYIDSVMADQVISDSDSILAGAQKLITTLTSSPSPSIDKTVSGVVRFNNENYVANSGAYTNTVTYRIKIKNDRADSGREKIWNPVITDNLTDIYNELSGVCSVATPSSRVTPANGGSIVGNTIVWDVPTGDLTHLGSNEEKIVTYTVDYTGCPGDATRKYDNIATLSADNINPISDQESVKVGVNTGPGGLFSKGGPDIANGTVVYHNDTYNYTLNATNNGAVVIGDIVMADKMDTQIDVVSVATPAGANATVYYNATGSANPVTTPPAYTITPGVGITGTGWTTVKPATPAWIAVYVPCLDSKFFPSPAGHTACYQKPTSTTATITVKLKPPAAVCSEYTVPNTGVFSLSAASPNLANTTLNTITPVTANDPLTTQVIPKLAKFNTESEIIAPNSAHVTDDITYTIKVKNTGVDNALNTSVTVQIPKATVNGVPNTPFDFVSATGGTLITTNLPNSVGIQIGTIPTNTTKTITVTLRPPKGIKNLDTATLNATISATDDNNCRPITTTLSKTVTVTSEPEVSITKSRIESLIPSGGDIHYTLRFNNTGTAPTTDTFVVDFIPTNAVFKRAYTTGTDAAGTTFTCSNCTVLFSDSLPSLPPGASPFDAITLADITTSFSPGTQISPGVWTSPFGTSTHWVAYKIDSPSLTPPMFVTGRTGTVGLTVTNDLDGAGPGTVGSPASDVITNESAIFSNELLQAIGNQVQTTIAPSPGLAMTKRANVATVAGNEIFSWIVDLYNDGSGPDSIVTLTDTMDPLGGTLQGVYFTWNSVAVGNGAPAGEVNITANPNVTLSAAPSGIITTTIDLTGYRGGNLDPLEGGTLRFEILTAPGITTGMNFINDISGTYTTGTITETATASHTLPVANPDLWIRKNVDNQSPLPGSQVGFTLTISNEGNHSAPNVSVSDTLPLGMCFVAGSTTLISPLSAGYTTPAPTVTGDCMTTPHVLTWNNTIVTPLGTTTLPADSPDISFSYRATVSAGTPSGTTLTNGAVISTTLTEDTVYTNASNQSVTTPLPDPYVQKSAPATALPGDPITYTISYGNESVQSVSNAYMIDTLPDFDSDGTADIRFVSISGTGGESFYYHSAPVSATPPVFDPVAPLTGGWTAAPGAVVSYIAIRKTTLAGLEGPRTITLLANLVDPDTNLPVPTGIAFTNTITITGAGDSDMTDNTATATTRTPGFDLTISKTGTRTGAVPGLTPGASNTYTLTFKNQGTVSVCDVHVRDTLGAGLSFAGTGHNFTTIGLVDMDNNPVTPVDPLGNPIPTPGNPVVTIVGDTLTADLGSNLCIPAGAGQSFEVYAKVASSTVDGTVVTNTSEVYTTGIGVEQVLDNNTSSVQTSVWRADVVATKTGAVTPGGSTTLANPGETIAYTIEYDNIGNADADNTILTDTIPSEVCFVVGSISVIPGTTIEYSNDNGSTWTYTPVGAPGAQDCDVKNFRILWNTPLPAPANFDGEGTLADFLNAGEVNTEEITVNGEEVVRLKVQDMFPTATSLSGTNGYGVTLGDLNGDGTLDIVTAGHTTTTKVYLNSGTGTFPTATSLSGTNGYGVTLGDLNGDGTLDIVTGGYTTTTKVYLNSGTGTFPTATSLSGTNGYGVTLGDLNGDGTLDIVTAGHTTTTKVYLNSGTGTFPTATSLSGTNGYGVTLGDLNGDGTLDIVTAGHTTTTKVYLNSGTGTFPTATSLSGTNGYGVTLGDLNGDGTLDIVTGGHTTTTKVYLNSGTGTFPTATSLSGITGVGVALGDLNGDGTLDIVTGGYTTTTKVYLNSGTGTFPTATNLSGITGHSVALGDLNGDGMLDIVTAGYTTTTKVYLNHLNEFVTSGTYTTNITAPTAVTAWNKLLVNADVPTDTSLTYTVLPSTCTGTPYVNAQPAPQGYVDISHIPNTVTSLCLRMNFASTNVNKTPVLDAWKATYTSPVKPKFTYNAVVKTSPQLGVIPNSVQITTTTAEINTGNNDALKEHQLIISDVSVKKTVTKTAALAGDTLVYTLTYKNDGPSIANAVVLTDTLPALVTAPAGIVVSATSGPAPVCTHSAGVITCDNDGDPLTPSTWNLAVNDTGTITITADILGTAAAGDILTNTTAITTTTYQIDTTNDADTVNTVIGSYPNLYIDKTGPTRANVDKDIVYSITYGNNGNTTAPDVTITDTFDPNVTFVSAVSTDGTMPACSSTGTTITCGGAGYSLPAGGSHTLMVTLRVNNDFNLLINKEIIDNDVAITTTIPESSISDNVAFYDIPVYPFALSSISGYVYIDTNGSITKDLGETPITGVTLSLTGTDIYGTPVARTTVTDATGLYTFSGLNPGTYTVTQTQPAGYDSTGASAGTNLVPVGNNGVVSGPNMIASITVGEGHTSLQNNFGEASGTIGNQVFYDQNTNGIFDAGDTGLAGVRILLVTDTNNNGVQDVGESVRVAYTDGAGNYQFTNLPFGNYITKVSDTAGVLSSYTAVSGVSTGGTDNEVKNVSGYHVTISGLTPSIQIADFGYTLTPFTPGTPGTIGTKVFSDSNGNGILDGLDIGIPNVSVDLYRDNDSSGTVTFGDTFLGRLFTDGSGDYLFGGLTLDRRYVVRVSDTLGNLSGYINTLGTPHTDNNGQNPLAYPVHLQTGMSEFTVTADFSYQPPYPDLKITKSHVGLNVQGGTATYNLVVENKSTASGNATSPIRVTDTLVSDLTYVSASGTNWDCSATVAPLVDCTYTGTYPVVPGTTLPTLTITATISATAVPPLTNTATVSTPLELSHVLADNTASDPVTYVAASADGVIGTTIWIDEDRDGERDVSEPGLPGITVRLYRDWDGDGLPDDINSDTIIDINDEIQTAQVTDGNGEYLFTGLDRDDLVNGYYDYLVTVDTAGIPSGYTHTTGTVATDNFSQVETNYPVRLSNTNPSNVTADFGYAPTVPDLAITKTHSGIVHQGDTVTFTITVSNTLGAGDVPVTNDIVVTDTMPAGMTLIPSATVTATNAISGVWNCSTSTATLLRCISNAGLAGGVSLPNIAAVIEVNPVSVPTSIVNTAHVATVRETGSSANLVNNTASDTVDVVLTNTGSIGNLVWDDHNGNGHYDTGEEPIGGVHVYLYRDVNEDGLVDAGDILIDTQITSTTVGSIGTYQFVNLERDLGLGYYPYIVRVEISDVTAINPLYTQTIGIPGTDNESQVQDYRVTLNSTNISDQTADFGFGLPPELILEKTISGSSTVHIGESMTFLLEVTNIGGGTTNGTDIVVTDTLPSNLTFSTTGSSPECSATGQVVTCILTGLPAVLAPYTGSYAFTIVSIANAVGNISNSADVTGGGISGSVVSLPSSGVINPTTWAITKSGIPLTGTPGTAAIFTITITNSGSGNTAGSYTVTDILTAGLVFTATGSDSRCSAVGQIVTCTDTAVLAPGASTSFEIKVDITSAGSYTNEATVTGGSGTSATSNSVTVIRTAPASGGGGGGGVIGTWCPSGQTWNGTLCVTSPKPVTPVLTPKPTVPNTPTVPSALRKSRLGLLWQTGSDTFGSCGYPVLTTPIKIGRVNKVSDVKFLEQFLNTYENEKLTVNGIYEKEDFNAVVRWQEKYTANVLKPWNVTKGTGYVYKTSLAQIARQYKTYCIPSQIGEEKESVHEKPDTIQTTHETIPSIETNVSGTRIRIPAINLDRVVYTTGTLKQVKDNVWHSPETEMPHEGGNTVFVGHRYVNLIRDAKGNIVQIPPKPGVFFDLPSVPVGSDIYVTTAGRQYHYRVTQSFEVNPDEVWVEDETVNPTLTLYTCTPLYTHNKRHVIRAELVK